MTWNSSGSRLLTLALTCSAFMADTAGAQGRLELSAGPVLALSGSPPTFGGHARIAVHVTSPGSPLALLVEGFGTEFRAEESGPRMLDGGVSTDWIRQDERQAGFAAIGGLPLSASGVVPVVRAGLTYSWSGVHTDNVSDDGALIREYRSGWRVEPVVGAGIHFPSGARRVLVEGRVYGAQAVNAYATLTVGITL